MSPPPNKNYFHYSIDYNSTQAQKLPANAADLLVLETGLSKQKIKKAMQQGAVWLSHGKTNKRLRQGNSLLKIGAKLDIYYDENLLSAKPPEPVLIKDEDAYSIWYKPCGLLSQGSLWGDSHAINRYAELQLKPQRPVLLIHRLDREACGLMLLAHNKKMAGLLSQLFQDRKVTKHYRAFIQGNIGLDKITLDKKLDGKAALTTVEPLYYDAENNRSLLSINIETGRKHQIRRHLADYGFPVLGDALYGDKKKSANTENLQLLSVYLAFVCPMKKKMKIFSLLENNPPRLPVDLDDNLESLLAASPVS